MTVLSEVYGGNESEMVRRRPHFVVVPYFVKMLMLEGGYCEISYYLNLPLSLSLVLESVEHLIGSPAGVPSIGWHGEASLPLGLGGPLAEMPLALLPHVLVD